jgi:hypothetical protein
MKSIREILGLPPEKTYDEVPTIGLTNVAIPFDLMVEIIVRQQSQLAQAHAELKGRMDAVEQIVAQVMDQSDHVHGDVIQLQQALEGAATHPVERVDEVTDQKAAEDKEKKQKLN